MSWMLELVQGMFMQLAPFFFCLNGVLRVAFDVLKTGKSGAKNGNVVPKKWEK